LKIALVTYAMHCGGVETFLLNLGKYLADKGHSVKIIVTERKGEWYPLILKKGLVAKFVWGGHLLGYLPFGEYLSALLTGLYIRHGQFDVVFLNNAKYAQASISLFNNHSKIVTVIHNDHPEIYKIGLANTTEWDSCVCVSEKIFIGVKERLSAKSIVLIHNGVSNPNEEGAFFRHQPAEGNLKILFVGRLENSHKGIFLIPPIILELLRREVRNFSITIVGEGNDKDELISMILKYDLDKFVTLIDTVPNDQVFSIMSQHHIFLMPSYYEGFPIVILESLSAGCVPVATHLPMITDITIENNKNGFLIPKDDIDGFADALSFFVINPEKWADFSNQAIQTYKKSYTIDSMGNKYIAIIDELLADKVVRPKRIFRFPLDSSLLKIYPLPVMMLKYIRRNFFERKN